MSSLESVSLRTYFSNGYILATVVAMVIVLQCTLWQNHFHMSVRQGVTCKAALQVGTSEEGSRIM